MKIGGKCLISVVFFSLFTMIGVKYAYDRHEERKHWIRLKGFSGARSPVGVALPV